MERRQIKLFPDDGLRKTATIRGFLAAESDGPQFVIVESQEPFGGQATGGCRRTQPIQSGLGGCQRDLLLKDDVYQRLEALTPRPKRRRTEVSRYFPEVRVQRG
jgi:hypothetical protein